MTHAPTLVVVDVQNGFVTGRTQHVLPVIQRLIHHWRERDWPVVFSRFSNPEGSGYEKWIHWTQLRDATQVALHPDVADTAEVVLDKTTYTVFTDEGETILDLHTGDTLVICGIATDSCVLKTAVDAFERDIEPVVAIDACATHGGQSAQEAGELVLGRFIGRGQMMTTDDVLDRFGSHNGSTSA